MTKEKFLNNKRIKTKNKNKLKIKNTKIPIMINYIKFLKILKTMNITKNK